MVSHSRLAISYEGSPKGFRSTIQHIVKEHRQLVWLGCAAVSLLSTRNLLVEHNVHYPLQIYAITMVTAMAYTLCLYPLLRKAPDPMEQGRAKRTIPGLLLAVSQCFAALSMLCLMQAILHCTNFPVLMMLTTIAFFAEGLLLFVAGYTAHSRAELIRISLLVLAGAGIIITEYRLSPKLAVAIPAMLFAGIANALRKLAIKYYPGDMAGSNMERRWFLGAGILGATACLISPWPWEERILFDSASIPLLIVNVMFTAAALLMEGSVIFPTDVYSGGCLCGTADTLQHARGVLSLLALTGITGCYSTLSIRRSYINWYQFWCFLFAILCISSRVQDAAGSRHLRQGETEGSYELLADSSTPPSNNIIAVDFVEEMDACQLQTRESESQGFSLRTVLVSMAIVVLWTAYLLLNFTERVYPRVDTILDRSYKSPVPVEVVISMYREPVDEVAQLISNLRSIPTLSQAEYTIYAKGEEVDKNQTEQHTGARNVIAIPNIGREGETYLNHILRRWDSLARQTVFLQADVHNSREFYPHLNNYFSLDRTGYLSLGWSGNVCNCDKCGDKFFWRDETQLFSRIQSRINNSSKCRNVLLSYKGQFIVSAARIHGIDRSIYHDLRQAFVDEKSWAHQEEFLQGRKDSMSEPWFGYTMERMWSLLFQCSDMDVGWKCPTLVSGWRIGGDINDCQCFD